MATVEKTVSILFSGDDQLSSKIQGIEKQFGSLANGVENIAAPLAGVADNVLKVDAALTALAVGGLVYAFAKSSEFETAVVELKKVLGDQPEALDAATKAAFELSRQYGESSAAVLLSAANFKQAGFTVEESILLTKNAMDLSIAGSIGSSEASELVIATLKGFKVPATEAARLIDVLNEVSNKYATNTHELGIGMAELSPIARLMGFSFEETAGILTPVIEIFRSGDEAATALKMGLLKLVDDSKPVRDALAALGVAQTDVNGKLRSGKDILYDVAKAFQSAEENDKLFLTSQLVGIRQAGRMVEVFDGLAKSTEITNVAMGAAGSAALEVAARLESSEVVVNRFAEGFKNLAIVVGDQFKSAAVEAIDGGTAIENALEDIIKDGTFKPVFDALSDFGTEMGEYLKGIAEAMPEAFAGVDFEGLLDALGDLGDELGDLFADVDLTDPEDLAEAVQFVVDSLESLVRVTKGMAEVFGPLIADIIETAKGFNLLDDETQESSGNMLGIAKAITSLGVEIGLMLVTIGQHAETMKKVFEIVIGAVGFMWDSTVITVEGILMAIAKGVEDLAGLLAGVTWGDLRGSLEGVSEDAKLFKEAMAEDIASRAEENLERLSRAFGTADDAIKETTKNIEDFAKTDAEIALQVETDRAELQKVADEIFGFVDGVKVDVDKAKPEIGITADTTEASKAIDNFYLKMVEIDGEMVETKVYTDYSGKTPEDIKKDIDSIPKEVETLLEIKLKGDIDTEIANIKATAKTAQTAMEWTAKLDIAKAGADAKIFGSIIKGIGATIKSTGDTLSNLFGLLADPALDTWAKWDIEEQINKENKMREEAHLSQMRLFDAQREYMEAKTGAFESGEGLIKINAEGLSPALELVMWEIIEKVQIRANEQNAEFLLGL